MTVRNDITVDFTQSPRIILIQAPSTEITLQDLVDTLRNIEEEFLNLDDEHLVDASGKEDLGGGVRVGITAQLNNAQILFESRTSPLVTGTITTGDSEGTNLKDSSATFQTDGIYAGCTVFNRDTQAMATVKEVVSETELFHFPLSGGDSTEWISGDNYAVYPNVQCSVSGGNLVAVDADGNSISPILQSANVQVVKTSSASATLQELEAIQYSSFNGGVTVDISSPYSGTEFPTGTIQQPVNNTADALTIAEERGFSTIYIIGDIVLDSGSNFSEYIFVGESMTKTKITINPDANVINSEFYDAEITGTLDGGNVLRNCLISDINYVNGYIEQCVLSAGTIVLGGNQEAHFLDCWSGVVGLFTPTIDMGGSGQGLGVRNYNGGLKIVNKSGTDKISIDLNSGQIILDSTVTNGEIVIRGIGDVIDNSSGATIITDDLINPANIADAILDESLSDHKTSGSLGFAISFIKGINGGRWKIDTNTNQMIFYDEDNTTELARFDLYDDSEQASTQDVFERRRV